MRQIIFFIILSFFFLAAAAFGIFCYAMHSSIIDFSCLQQDVAAKPSILLDCHGHNWGQFQVDKREYVFLEAMPPHLIQAFLVTEDRNFFTHPGISLRGIIRSLFVNLIKGKRVQGASTITQQLVRLKFLSSKKTVGRKIQEQLYAILVERSWTKDQILEAYLNNVYFGYGVYGVAAAAKRFWNTDISNISIDQAAVLSGIMKSPRTYSPIHALKSCQKRRDLILGMMRQYDMITHVQLQQALAKPLKICQPEQNNYSTDHIKEMIRQQMETLVGKDALYTKGLVIQTTLDMDVQQQAHTSYMNCVTKLRQTMHEKIDGGLVTIDSQTGAVRALIGGYDFKKSKFNRAVQAYRQMGSVFKIFVYAAALEQGLHFYDVEIDQPLEMVQNNALWRPDNYNKKFIGPMTRAYALSHSNNIVTIKTMLQTGIDHVIDMAKRCGIVANMPAYPSLALGCVDVTVAQTAASFNVIANHGWYVQPYSIAWIKDEQGKKIYNHTPVRHKVLDSKIADQVARVLSFGISRLENSISNSLHCQAIGKTGTNNDSRTCWFCGATPELTTAIYVGCDYNASLGQFVFGSKTAFPIWFNMHLNLAKTKTNFYYDPQLKNCPVNWITGEYSPDLNDPNVVSLLI